MVIDLKEKLTAREFAALSRYKARLDFAHSLRSLNTLELSAATTDAYFVLTKLGLAFSAIEALRAAIGKDRQFVLRQSEVQQAIESGELAALIQHLHRQAASQKRGNPKELEGYLNGQCDEDLLPLVKHARHVMFHGSVTPNTVSLAGSRKRRGVVLALATATLALTESELEHWLRTVVAKRSLDA